MRRNKTPEDVAFEKEFNKSMSVSSYTDEIFDAIQEGRPVSENIIPDFSGGMPNKRGSTSNESDSLFVMNTHDTMLNVAASMGGIETIIQSTPQTMEKKSSKKNIESDLSKPKYTISTNQFQALKKYPSLIEFLGTASGERIAQSIIGEVNIILAEKIEENTKIISKTAASCKSVKQNLKQFFVGENDEWVCEVTANGPFRGDEAFYYKTSEDKAYVLRKSGEDFQDVTSEFNVVHIFAKRGE